jgi:uncharacterized damage-inducible protein DinB
MQPSLPPAGSAVHSPAVDEAPRSIAEVLQRVDRNWSALQQVCGGLSEPQLSEPGPEGWSVKDHLSHITAWEKALTLVLRGEPQYRAFGLDETTYDRIDSVDQLNAHVYQRGRDRPSADVLSELERGHDEVVAELTRLSDTDLERTIADFGSDPNDARPIRQKIAGDSYEHYAEHTLWLGELLAANQR